MSASHSRYLRLVPGLRHYQPPTRQQSFIYYGNRLDPPGRHTPASCERGKVYSNRAFVRRFWAASSVFNDAHRTAAL